MLGLDFPDADHGYVTASNAIMTTTDGGETWTDYAAVSEDLIVMAVAFNDSTVGVASGLSLVYTAQCYTTDGQTYTKADDNAYQIDAVQDVEVVGDSSFAAVGSFGRVNGVAFSKNGMDYTNYDWGFTGSEYALPRYGAFPSETTWYVAGGTWPESDSAMYTNNEGVFTADQVHARSKYLHISKKTGSPIMTAPQRTAGDANNTFVAAIQKTTDGGATFTNVFVDVGNFYFNQISCTDENTCFAAGEGDVGAFIYATTDGGANWEVQLTAAAGESIVALKMLSATEGWAAGAMMISQFNIEGHFYYTSDAGATWTLQPVLKGYYVQDLSFVSETAAWGTAITVAQIGELIQYS
jgi:photosystem II stability/assembly factor-like uncharacterized protein